MHPGLELAVKHGAFFYPQRPRLNVVEEFLQLEVDERHFLVAGKLHYDIIGNVVDVVGFHSY